jgi:hypothetical protein
MRVLIACEESQTITAKYRAKGIEAFSCDLKPAKINADWHYQTDVFEVINFGWDLMISHPPCTYLSFAGNGWFDIEKYGQKAIERHEKRKESMDFFMKLWNANIPRIAIENPRGYPISAFRKADQTIQPWYFGDEHKKATCLWLKNLPKLKYTLETNLFEMKTATNEPKPIFIDKSGKKRYFTDAFAPGLLRQEMRSKTFDGIAEAIVNQWLF